MQVATSFILIDFTCHCIQFTIPTPFPEPLTTLAKAIQQDTTTNTIVEDAMANKKAKQEAKTNGPEST